MSVLKLYYTNSLISLGVQTSPMKSLGGLVSGSLVPNDVLNNLFSDVSSLSVNRNLTETIGLALKNETGVLAEDIYLYYDYPSKDSQVKIEVAAVVVGLNDCDEPEMELIPNIRSKPLVGNFVEAAGAGNAVLLGDLAVDAYIGLWFRKTLKPAVIPVDQGGTGELVDCDTLFDDFENGVIKSKKETVDLIIHWGGSISTSVSI